MSGARFFIASDKRNARVYYRISLGVGKRLIGKTETKIKNPKNFDSKDQDAYLNFPELKKFNDKVEDWKSDYQGKPDIKEILFELIEDHFKRGNQIGKKKSYTLNEFFGRKIKDLKKKEKSEDTMKIYGYARDLLIQYGKKKKVRYGINYRHVTDDFLEDFEEYLLEDAPHAKTKKKGFSQNYTNLIISCVVSVMNMALKKGQHNNTSFKGFELSPTDSFAVYLEQEELQSLINLELSNETDEAVRDYFVLLAKSGIRVGDAMKLTSNDITKRENGDPIILYRAEKTGKLHAIDIKDDIHNILKRWKTLGRNSKMGFPNERKNINIYKEKINSKIGRLCKEAGIDTIVRGKPKYEWVKSHTGKRTAATLAYKDDKSIEWIMENITLHSAKKTTINYIKCDDHLEQLMKERKDVA